MPRADRFGPATDPQSRRGDVAYEYPFGNSYIASDDKPDAPKGRGVQEPVKGA